MFEYPIDSNLILRKKKKIKRDLSRDQKFLCNIKIAILGGSTTSEIADILELFLMNNGIKPSIYQSDYNKFYEDAVFGNKYLDNFKPDIIYIHTSVVNIEKFPVFSNKIEEIEDMINNEASKYKSIWRSISKKNNCLIIQNNFDYPIDRSLGNLDSYSPFGKTNFLNKINLKLSSYASNYENVFINDINYLSSYLGLQNWFDKTLWHTAKYAMSMGAIPELAFNISKIVNAILGQSKKCLVLDLDNTCWGGVIGEDDLDGISLGNESSIGESFINFQKYVKELKNRGILVAVSSKNDHDTAVKGFSHPNTVLLLDDFSSFKANWENKDINIKNISKELNIGLDALVFIDDNPIERNLIISNIKEVSVPNIGKNITEYINHIDKNGFFETVSLSKDDLNRGEYYIQNKKRNDTKAEYKSYEDYLISLKMSANISTFNKISLNRITQLVNKTNQFNLTTKRLNYSQILSISKKDNYIKLFGDLKDKFGDNGIVSVIIGRLEKKICYIDLFLMSCRVLKRNLEHAMIDELVKNCMNSGILLIKAHYFKTDKNEMVNNLYDELNFELVNKTFDKSVWQLEVSNYQKLNNTIKIINE
jgi:FkbH-like protein